MSSKEPSPSPPTIQYGSPTSTPKLVRKLKKTAFKGLTPPVGPRRPGSRVHNRGSGQQGIHVYQAGVRAHLGRRQYEFDNPAKGGLPLFSGGLPQRVDPRVPPDEKEPVEEKASEAKQTVGMPVSGQMELWESRKEKAINRLPPKVQRLAKGNENWAENLMRRLDAFTAQYNLGRRTMQRESGDTSRFDPMTLDEVIFKKFDLVEDIINSSVATWREPTPKKPAREKTPEPYIPDPIPATPPQEREDPGEREPSPATVEYGSPEKHRPANELLDAFNGIIEELPDVPDPHQSILPQTATLRRRPAEPPDFAGDFGSPTMAPEPSYGVFPGTPPEQVIDFPGFEDFPDTPQRSDYSWMATHDGSIVQSDYPGLPPLPDEIPEESLVGGASASTFGTRTLIDMRRAHQARLDELERQDSSIGTRELMNIRGGAQARLDVLHGQDPIKNYMQAFIPGYKKGRAERVQRSERSVASSFQRARSKMLNVPRGLQKSGGIRGMQVLKKQNFHIEQLSPGELILHARIINDGVVAQVRALVGKISRTILVEGQKVPRKKVVNQILSILGEKNHVRITVLDS